MTRSSMFGTAATAALVLFVGRCCGQAEMQTRVELSEAPANLDTECDIDGDGEIARYVATRSSRSTLESAEGEY